MSNELYQLHRPGEVLNYSFDWAGWTDGFSIDAHAWTITPTGPTIAPTNGAVVKVSGFQRGTTYRLVNEVTLSNGEKAARTLVLRCEVD